jgi:hypothetical protein
LGRQRARRALPPDDRRWLPQSNASVTGFSDPDCTEALAEHHGGACGILPQFAVHYGAEFLECEGSAADVYEIGDLLTDPQRHIDSADGCSAASFTSERSYDTIPVPHTTFLPVETAQRGEGRLRQEVRENADGQILRASHDYFDTEWDTHCVPRRTEDGVWRCLPHGLEPSRFADDACTQPLIRDTDPCRDPVIAMYSETPHACETRYTAHALGATHEGPGYIALSEEDCVAAEADEEDAVYRLVGEALDPSEFVALEHRVE